MLGKTNVGGTGKLQQYQVVCYYWGKRSAASGGVPTASIQYAYNKDYLSFDSSTQKFTVLQDFNATVKVVGSGARTGDVGGSGNYPLSISFRVNSSTKISGTITWTGSGTPSTASYSFKKNDVFWVQGSHEISVYSVDMGFTIEIA